MLLGIPGDNTFSNYQEAQRTFWRSTVLPSRDADRQGGRRRGFARPAWHTSLDLRPDLDQIEALTSEREALWARIEKASFLTPNENGPRSDTRRWTARCRFQRTPDASPRVSAFKDTSESEPYGNKRMGTAEHCDAAFRDPAGAWEVKFTSLDFKRTDIDGTFEGYASLFNREDLGRDIVLPGAFGESLAQRGARGIKLLYQYDANQPIGVWTTLQEDSRRPYAHKVASSATSPRRER